LRLPGHRIVKTAVAITLTAFICIWLEWPPVFAVITAIVTLEPTVTDSIKKGIVRFPASAIGSFYAVLFISLFGNSTLTYTLAGTLTIITCYRLKLHAGLLVATITSVAMIEVIHDQFMMAFFIRLGTTSIGLVVSTLVNMFIFPPNYQKAIEQHLQLIRTNIGELLVSEKSLAEKEKQILHIRKLLDKTKQFILYEVNESQLRPFIDKNEDEQTDYLRQLEHVELIYYHLKNIAAVSLKGTTFSKQETNQIQAGMAELAAYFTKDKQVNVEHVTVFRQLMNTFWKSNQQDESHHPSLLPNELIILYELISIYALIKEEINT